MARPRIFVSSTFYDLKHIRSSLEGFIETLGYEPVLSEKGNIAYNPDIALDESCYREAKTCDVFVLIVGGRYGSAASGQEGSVPRDFHDRYESITKREYEAAVERDIPVYILIDRSVHAEYETFRKNRDNKEISYAHVDSVNVFHLIDKIMAQPRNNPVHQFDRHTEIEAWLREQWAGLFKEMISRTTGQKQLVSLAGQVTELANISTTFKRYLEEIVSRVSEKEAAEEIIKSEEQRLAESRRWAEFEKADIVNGLVRGYRIPLEEVHRMWVEAKSIDHLARMLEKQIHKGIRKDPKYKSLADAWRKHPSVVERIQTARRALHLSDLAFEVAKKKKTKRPKGN